MAQFDIYKNPSTKTNKVYSFLVDVRNSVIDQLATRLVVPLTKNKTRNKKPNTADRIRRQDIPIPDSTTQFHTRRCAQGLHRFFSAIPRIANRCDRLCYYWDIAFDFRLHHVDMNLMIPKTITPLAAKRVALFVSAQRSQLFTFSKALLSLSSTNFYSGHLTVYLSPNRHAIPHHFGALFLFTSHYSKPQPPEK